MNILFLSRLFYPHIGGVEKHVLEISKRLIKKGHKVIVVTEDLLTTDIPVYLQLKKLPEHEVFNSIEIYRIPVGKNEWLKKFEIWFWLFKNINLIKKADVVHAHDVFFWYLPFRLLYPKKPAYTTFHGYENYPVPPKAIIIRKISEILSWGNICVGQFMEKWYRAKPMYITYGGVEIPNYSPCDEAGKFQIPNKIKKESAIFIGRLDDQTGILDYVKAIKLVRKEYPNFDFAVVGDGPYRKLIEKDFKVLGFKDNPTEYLQKNHFAFVSRYLSMLEAMAAKRLVLAVYDNPLKKDYLKMSPFANHILITDSSESLAKNIKYFLENPKEKEELISKAFEWAKKQSWENLANMYVKLWQQNR